jgi:polar amino acid transport system substrate-binding protein
VADAVLADRDFLMTYMNDSAGEFEFIGTAMPPGQGVSPGVRQSDTELRETLSATIAAMKADGSLNALLVQWFGDEVPLFD